MWKKHLQEHLDSWREQGLARQLKPVMGRGVRIVVDGIEVLSFASNDYLGLSTHPQVIAAAKAALDAAGAGSTASPLIVGHRTEHAGLEAQLAEFKRSEAALVFPSGYQAALATLGALAGPEHTIILDRLAHACLLDGAKLSGARVRIFKHNDPADLAVLLQRERRRRCIVAIESLYSMDGDLAPLEELIELVTRFGALLMVDEAHATGVIGDMGRGALEAAAKTHGRLPANIIAMGTLSKALGCQGGFICATRQIVNSIVHAGRAFVFSTALSPTLAAAASTALALLDGEPERRWQLAALSATVRAGLRERGFEVVPLSRGPIIPVLVGDERRAVQWSETLLSNGIYVPAVRYPTVKKGHARLRISMSASHTLDDCTALLAGFETFRTAGAAAPAAAGKP
ncbi:MAG: 8-amino-7-oxononanoate synthase [Planctomycetota bacterium]|nr:8-amino-7-oxononanoate synthase [Planctomycetota bacterium]